MENVCVARDGKIVIIGSPGAGKTTLARKLGPMLDMKVYHLDRLFWECGWKAKARDTRIDILQNIMREKQWIIEGTYIHVSELHLKAADTIIFLDISPVLCSQRLIERHREYHRRSRRDIPERCTDKLSRLRLLKVLTFRFHGLRKIKQTLRSYNPEQIIWLRRGGKNPSSGTRSDPSSVRFSTLLRRFLPLLLLSNVPTFSTAFNGLTVISAVKSSSQSRSFLTHLHNKKSTSCEKGVPGMDRKELNTSSLLAA